MYTEEYNATAPSFIPAISHGICMLTGHEKMEEKRRVMMFVRYRGHQGQGTHAQERIVLEACHRNRLMLQTFEDGTDLGEGYTVELSIPSPNNQYLSRGRIDLINATTVQEITDWLDAYGRGEVWD